MDLDHTRANRFPQDYDTDLESEWAHSRKMATLLLLSNDRSFVCVIEGLFADGTDFSWETIQTGRNRYYQKQTAEAIRSQASQTIALLTAALNRHLNIGQDVTMNTSSVFMSVKTVSLESIANTLIRPIGNAQIHLPSALISNETANQTVSLRVGLCPLAFFSSPLIYRSSP